MIWFDHTGTLSGGHHGHRDVGYDSYSDSQIDAQIGDMTSRGIAGVIEDWYGAGSFEDTVAMHVRDRVTAWNAAHAVPFAFSIMVDQGILRAAGCATSSGGCTQKLIDTLVYVDTTYESASGYARVGGRPLVTFFDVDNCSFGIDWMTVRAKVAGSPLFIQENSIGFRGCGTAGECSCSPPGYDTDGAFAWVQPNTTLTSCSPPLPSGTGFGASYLSSFYSTALATPSKLPVGGVYKGFDDCDASWGRMRYLAQDCGQSWLSTFGEIAMYYPASAPLPELQLVTWNDYEEGTELETGIDGCLTVGAPAFAGSMASWTLTGATSAVDHFTLYASLDGTNLATLTSVLASARSFDLASLPALSAGRTYQIWVQAAGKPSILDALSPAASYSP